MRAADRSRPPAGLSGWPPSSVLGAELGGTEELPGLAQGGLWRLVPGVPPPPAGMADTTLSPLHPQLWAGLEGKGHSRLQTAQTQPLPPPVPVRPRPIRLSGGRCVLQLCVWIKSLIKGTRAPRIAIHEPRDWSQLQGPEFSCPPFPAAGSQSLTPGEEGRYPGRVSTPSSGLPAAPGCGRSRPPAQLTCGRAADRASRGVRLHAQNSPRLRETLQMGFLFLELK